MVNFAPLTKAQALCALYNNAKAQGLRFAKYRGLKLTEEQAETLIRERTERSPITGEKPYSYFDYLYGRVIKVKLVDGSNEFDERLYDRDNGEGSAREAIEYYKKSQPILLRLRRKIWHFFRF